MAVGRLNAGAVGKVETLPGVDPGIFRLEQKRFFPVGIGSWYLSGEHECRWARGYCTFYVAEKLPALKIDRVTYNYYHLKALSADGQLYRRISRQWQRYNPILTEWTTVSPAPTDVIFASL